MNIRDPFLNSIGILLDRVAVWAALTGGKLHGHLGCGMAARPWTALVSRRRAA
jgi:hypothetical protein